jgi:hypothetical protein
VSALSQRYECRPPPKGSNNRLLSCAQGNISTAGSSSSSDSGSSTSSSSSSEADGPGYIWMNQSNSSSSISSGHCWPVMQLLQQGGSQLWGGEQCIVDEPGPLGVNCCGLLDSRHVFDQSLIWTPQTAWSALE